MQAFPGIGWQRLLLILHAVLTSESHADGKTEHAVPTASWTNAENTFEYRELRLQSNETYLGRPELQSNETDTRRLQNAASIQIAMSLSVTGELASMHIHQINGTLSMWWHQIVKYPERFKAPGAQPIPLEFDFQDDQSNFDKMLNFYIERLEEGFGLIIGPSFWRWGYRVAHEVRKYNAALILWASEPNLYQLGYGYKLQGTYTELLLTRTNVGARDRRVIDLSGLRVPLANGEYEEFGINPAEGDLLIYGKPSFWHTTQDFIMRWCPKCNCYIVRHLDKNLVVHSPSTTDACEAIARSPRGAVHTWSLLDEWMEYVKNETGQYEWKVGAITIHLLDQDPVIEVEANASNETLSRRLLDAKRRRGTSCSLQEKSLLVDERRLAESLSRTEFLGSLLDDFSNLLEAGTTALISLATENGGNVKFPFSLDRRTLLLSSPKTFFVNIDPAQALYDSLVKIYTQSVIFRQQDHLMSENRTVAAIFVDESDVYSLGQCGVGALHARDIGFNKVYTLPSVASYINGLRALEMLTGDQQTGRVDVIIICGGLDFSGDMITRLKAFEFEANAILFSRAGILEELTAGVGGLMTLGTMDALPWPPLFLDTPCAIWGDMKTFMRRFMYENMEPPYLPALQMTAVLGIISGVMRNIPESIKPRNFNVREHLKNPRVPPVPTLMGFIKFDSHGRRKLTPGVTSTRQVFPLDIDHNADAAAVEAEFVLRVVQGTIKFVLDDAMLNEQNSLRAPTFSFMGYSIYELIPDDVLEKVINAEFYHLMEFPSRTWNGKRAAVLPCPPGSQYAGGECHVCPAGKFLGGSLSCDYCVNYGGVYKYADGLGFTECLEVPTGAIYQGVENTPIASPGHYRFDMTRNTVARTKYSEPLLTFTVKFGVTRPAVLERTPFQFPVCLQPADLCLGNNTCKGMNTGVMCGSCLPGSTRSGMGSNQRECVKCSSKMASWLKVVLIIVLWILGLVFLLRLTDHDAQRVEELRSLVTKQAIHYMQMFAITYEVVGGNTNFWLPEFFLRPGEQMALDCLFPSLASSDYESRVNMLKTMWMRGLLLYAVGFLGIFVAYIIIFILRGCKKNARRGVRRLTVKTDFCISVANGCFTWAYLMYNVALRLATLMNKCSRTNIPGLFLLKQDLEFVCDSDEVADMTPNGALIVGIYLIGPPAILLMCIILYRRSDYTNISTRRRFAIFLCGYRPDYFWMEIVLMLRSGLMVYAANFKFQSISIMAEFLIVIMSLFCSVGSVCPVPAHAKAIYTDVDIWVHLAILINLCRLEQWDGSVGVHHLDQTNAKETLHAFYGSESMTFFSYTHPAVDIIWYILQAVCVFKLLSAFLLYYADIKVWSPGIFVRCFGSRLGLDIVTVKRKADGSATLDVSELHHKSKEVMGICIRDLVRAVFDARSDQRLPGAMSRTEMVLHSLSECIERAVGARRTAEENQRQKDDVGSRIGNCCRHANPFHGGAHHKASDKEEDFPEAFHLVDDNWPPADLVAVARTKNREMGLGVYNPDPRQQFHMIMMRLLEETVRGGTGAFVHCAQGAYVHVHADVLRTVVPALTQDVLFGTIDAGRFSSHVVSSALEFVYVGNCRVKADMLKPLFDLGCAWRFDKLRDVTLRVLPTEKTRLTMRELALAVPSVEYDLLSRYLPLHVDHKYIASQAYKEDPKIGAPDEDEPSQEIPVVIEENGEKSAAKKQKQQGPLSKKKMTVPSWEKGFFDVGERVFHVCISMDGTLLALSNSKGETYIYTVDGGASISVVKSSSTANWAHFSPNGVFLAVACADSTVQIFIVDTGAMVLQLHANYPEQNIAELLEIEAEQELDKMFDEPFASCLNEGPTEFMHKQGVYCVEWEPNSGDYLLCGGADGKVRILDAHTSLTKPALEIPHRSPINCVAFSPDASHVLATTQDGKLFVYSIKLAEAPDAEKVKTLVTIVGTRGGFSIQANPSSSRQSEEKHKSFLSWGESFFSWGGHSEHTGNDSNSANDSKPVNTVVRRGEREPKRQVRRGASKTSGFSGFSSLGKSQQQAYVIMQVIDQECCRTEPADADKGEDINWQYEYQVDAIDSFEAMCYKVMQPAKGSDEHDHEIARAYLPSSSWFPNGFDGSIELLGSQMQDTSLLVKVQIVATDLERLGTYQKKFCHQHNGMVTSAIFSGDGALVLTACLDNRARLINAETGELIRTFQHAGDVLYADFSPDHQRIATCCTEEGDAKIVTFNLRTGKRLEEMKSNCRYMYSLDFDKSGQLLLVGCSDGKARWIDGGGADAQAYNIQYMRSKINESVHHLVDDIRRDMFRRSELARLKSIQQAAQRLQIQFRDLTREKNPGSNSNVDAQIAYVLEHTLAVLKTLGQEAYNECPSCHRVFELPDPVEGHCPVCEVPVIRKDPLSLDKQYDILQQLDQNLVEEELEEEEELAEERLEEKHRKKEAEKRFVDRSENIVDEQTIHSHENFRRETERTQASRQMTFGEKKKEADEAEVEEGDEEEDDVVDNIDELLGLESAREQAEAASDAASPEPPSLEPREPRGSAEHAVKRPTEPL